MRTGQRKRGPPGLIGVPETDTSNFSDGFCQGIEADSFSGRDVKEGYGTEFRQLTHLPVETTTIPESSCIYRPSPDSLDDGTRVLPCSAYTNTFQKLCN